MRESACVPPFFPGPTPSNPPARATHPTWSRATHRHRDKTHHSRFQLKTRPFPTFVLSHPAPVTCPRYVNALIDSNQCGDLCSSWFFARDRIKWSLSRSLMVRNLPGMCGAPYSPLSPLSFMRYSARNAEKKLNKLKYLSRKLTEDRDNILYKYLIRHQ